MQRILLTILFTSLLTVSASAQHRNSPYSGMENRQIKALSKEEIEGYLNGSGMGTAMAAELNHYPGPKHVIEFADDLSVSSKQLVKIKSIFDRMKRETASTGKKIVEKEKELDILFEENRADEKKLHSLLQDIGKLKAKFRYYHLRAHLKMKDLLSSHQIMMYDNLREYDTSGEHKHMHSDQN